MPRFRVECLEKFIVRTVYCLEARNEVDAKNQVRDGKAGYSNHHIEEGGDEFIGFESVTAVEPGYDEIRR